MNSYNQNSSNARNSAYLKGSNQRGTHLAPPSSPPPKAPIPQNDDEFLDISDNDLIRASQVVESQLKFTNNVHHTTSNAMNIFSQFGSNAVPVVHNNINPANISIHAPSMNIHYGGNLTQQQHQQQQQYHGPPEEQLKQLLSEKMQKEGEIRILRDKMKKQEQEMQRMRQASTEQGRKSQQRYEELKKATQKKIEVKEIENQFKSQEISELMIKCKQQEALLKRYQASKPMQHASVFDEINNSTNNNRINSKQLLKIKKKILKF
jgi:hypothetical protein